MAVPGVCGVRLRLYSPGITLSIKGQGFCSTEEKGTGAASMHQVSFSFTHPSREYWLRLARLGLHLETRDHHVGSDAENSSGDGSSAPSGSVDKFIESPTISSSK